MPLRIGRFYFLCLIFMSRLINENRANRSKVFEDIEEEWENIKRISGFSSEELMALFFYIVRQYLKNSHKFESFPL